MAFAVALIILIVGSVLFHILSPWYLTPLASNWGLIDFTIDVTFWVTGIVFVAVNGFMAYCVIKFRYNKEKRSEYEPENPKLEFWLTAITAVGVAAMLAPGLIVWAEFVTVPDDADEIEAIGQQWHWSYRLPGDDGKFGNVDAKLISDDNPFGMDPDDPHGQDDRLIESNVVHLPIDRNVKINLRSKDVLHNFTVTQFRVKMDLVPGLVSYLWLKPTKVGEFEVLCEELCGIGHFAMRGKVVVDEAADYEAWYAAQPTYAETLARPQGDPVAGQAQYAVCVACHGPEGKGMLVMNSPKIAGQEDWYLRRQLNYYKTGARGAHPQDTFGQQMAPMVMTLGERAGHGGRHRLHRHPARRARRGHHHRRCGARRGHLGHLRCLPRPRGPGHQGAKRAAHGGHDRLVLGPAAGELQGGHKGAPSGRPLWLANGRNGSHTQGRRCRERRHRLHQHLW